MPIDSACRIGSCQGVRLRLHRGRATALMAMMVALILPGPSLSQVKSSTPVKRPNVVIILFDDAALMDLGIYGGEASTPHIDAIGRRGTLFTRYATSPLCSPSRAMLLTGLTNHQAGVATIKEVLPKEHVGKPGYGLHLEANVATLPERLVKAGYHTFMSGKWHLGDGPGQLPGSHGFQRSFALDASGADNWDDKPYMPFYNEAPWFEDDKPTAYPSGQFSSTVIVDKVLGYLDKRPKDGQPFLAYVAFQAVHIPVQAPRAYTQKYAGRFDRGWEQLARDRFARAKALGLINPNARPPAMHPSMRRWDSLSPQEQKLQARAMEVYAGMIEATDAEIGRLVDRLRAEGELENTIFVITSDNGPEPSNPGAEPGFNQWMWTHGYNRRLDNLGERGSHNWIGPEWASAVATPGYLFKFYTSSGGLHVPMIMAGPGIAAGQKTNAPAFVQDVTPTLLDLVGEIPAIPGSKPISGRSQAQVLAGQTQSVYGPGDSVGIEVSGNAAITKGDYTLVKYNPPFGDNQWRLYHVTRDPGQTQDLSASLPAVRADLERAYAAYAKANGVLELPPGYKVQRQAALNSLKRQWQFYGGYVIGFLGLVFAGGWFLLRRMGKRRATQAKVNP
ncbi:arylsulfatase [Candidatus Phycosocius bacilliformis]|uniref:Arylsulfatase n=2 Tax=Candidatus Phycosocius bacilliformis TaxID=1445552 RepID=A0A2P2EE24_9PROT|nr:arylsulfatase [Candidatus Phycosocius bacilliformis]